ncbi:Alcohol dehydrogenase YqhD [Dickeya dianthicola]|nr:hypothetical protein DDI_2593 [Dickeya dianthicola RNS04.9]AYC19631.1 Alcohol dehydrogenase YqhD [Dickeya dianthicola]
MGYYFSGVFYVRIGAFYVHIKDTEAIFMLGFEYFNPTRILFGPGKLSEIATCIPKNSSILITYVRGSTRKYSTLDEAQ